MKRILFCGISIIISFLNVACKSDSKKVDESKINNTRLVSMDHIKVDLKTKKNMPVEELYGDIKFIPLKGGGTMGEILKFEIHGNKFYFQTPNSIFIYSNKGIFIREINRLGNGPGEYLVLSDFYVNEVGHGIEIYDSKKKKINRYDSEGNFISDIDVQLDGYAFTKFPNDKYAVYIGSGYYNEESNNRLNILNSHGKIERKYIPIKDNEAKFLHLADLTNFKKFKDKRYFLYGFNDTIYRFKETSIYPEYYIDFQDNKLPSEFLEETYPNIMVFLEKCKKTNYAFRLIGFFETEDIIAFGFMHKYDIIHAYYSKKDKTCMVVDEFEYSSLFPKVKEKSSFQNLPKAGFENKLFTVINANKFIEFVDESKDGMINNEWEEYKNNHPEINAIYENVEMLDNPIIMMGTLKQF